MVLNHYYSVIYLMCKIFNQVILRSIHEETNKIDKQKIKVIDNKIINDFLLYEERFIICEKIIKRIVIG
ncbi:hypothetical protein CBF37_05395 [Vagococcus vulneris]|uniref:Uncharacterized protein n=1 Tax=Vagococcus vulneris TaxID=1977869 RepID=A0A429ZYP3_9ENTE|nr:hypothetical protein CBF37_05395 [Vagococcus vulneris]